MNSPETPIFQKSKLLYGFWKSKDAIRDAKSVYLVEGQMDFLMSWQAGVKNIAADLWDGSDDRPFAGFAPLCRTAYFPL